MIKTILATAVTLFATSAMADGYSTRQGVVVDVEAVYSNSYTYVIQEQCFEQHVPVYKNSQGSIGDVFAGAIIGGVIGNQFGGGSGKDAMTVLGAIVGADVANKNGSRQIVGYSTETRCENQTVYVSVEQRVYSHSTITFVDNGRSYNVRFQK
jgi:outer membrane lipoprotein SlyB